MSLHLSTICQKQTEMWGRWRGAREVQSPYVSEAGEYAPLAQYGCNRCVDEVCWECATARRDDCLVKCKQRFFFFFRPRGAPENVIPSADSPPPPPFNFISISTRSCDSRVISLPHIATKTRCVIKNTLPPPALRVPLSISGCWIWQGWCRAGGGEFHAAKPVIYMFALVCFTQYGADLERRAVNSMDCMVNISNAAILLFVNGL